MKPLSCFWVSEAECAGVKCLTGTDGEAVLDELAVFGVDGSLADFHSSITLVGEERMSER